MKHLIHFLIHSVTEDEALLDGLLQLGQELVVDALLDQDPVGGDARLTHVAELGRHAAGDGGVDIWKFWKVRKCTSKLSKTTAQF